MREPKETAPHSSRREKLQVQLRKRKLAGLLVTDLANIFYLTGFRGSAGAAIIGREESRLWVDPRYTLQAREQVRGLDVMEARRGILKAAVQWARRRKLKRLGFEDISMTSRTLSGIKRESDGAIQWTPGSGLVEALRIIKDPEEIECIRQAGKITAEVFGEIRPQICPGACERDLAAEIEYRMKRKGADGPAFETIVASGERSAWPHARSSAKLLQKSELVIIDLGAILSGYAADMTRTLYLGEPDARIRKLYNAVLEAERRGIGAAKAGRTAGDVDSTARSYLQKQGLGEFFTHSTGHGVGIEIHELPRVARKDRTKLEAGCIITVEPGVYIEGLGGIRIEDTVLVTEHGPEELTPAAKGNDEWLVTSDKHPR